MRFSDAAGAFLPCLLNGIPCKAAGARRRGNHVKRIARTVRLAFFEIAFDAGHLVHHMGEAQHRAASRMRESVECGGFHLDRERTFCTRGGDVVFCLAVGCIRGPGGATVNDIRQGRETGEGAIGQATINLNKGRGRQVVMAGASSRSARSINTK